MWAEAEWSRAGGLTSERRVALGEAYAFAARQLAAVDPATFREPEVRTEEPWRLGARNVWAVEDALNANRHQALPTPDAEYWKWKLKFDRWWEANGRPAHEWPTHYPKKDKATWLWP